MNLRDALPPQFLRLALRRLLPFGVWVPIVLCFVLALVSETTGSATLGPAHPQAAADALAAARTKQAVWSVLLIVAGPLLIVGAARSARFWSNVDADWFAPLPVPRGRWATLTGAGIGAVVLVLCLSTAILAELRSGSPASALRWMRTLEHPAVSLVAGDAPARWISMDPMLSDAERRAGTLLIARPTVAPGSGPGVTVRFSARLGVEEELQCEARIFGRSKLELSFPRSPFGQDAEVELELQRIGDGAVCVLPPRSIDLFEPAGSPRLASVAMFLQCLVALGAWALLAAGLGAWMRPSLAALLTLALCTLPAWFSPSAGLVDAWRLVGAGYVPPGPGSGEWLGGGCLLVAGYLLLRRGCARGRTLS